MKPSINSDCEPQTIHTEVLVVGGGTGGTAAAIQAARRGAKVTLVSQGQWLGGMLTSAGVCAPDGNELTAFQTGIWGAFLNELRERENAGLDHGWVSFFTYQPKTGAEIFASWVDELPNLDWKKELTPTAVIREGDRILGVQFDQLTIYANITIDGTELGDLLELGNIPYRLGWELQDQWQEPSAPTKLSTLTETYPVQAPTWVFYLKDGKDKSDNALASKVDFSKAWKNYGSTKFMGYGGIPQGQYMMNWPIHGNDYGEGVHRLFGSVSQQQEFLSEALAHSQNFAEYVIKNAEFPYRLAQDVFPTSNEMGGNAFALHPYYRESRRLIGLQTVIEQDLLPIQDGIVSSLSRDQYGAINSISIGNYANDHHYPSGDIPLAPKSMIWGGRWTGTSFTMPFNCLIPESVDGFLVCEKNQSISHMANGATRLQPVVLGCGQAAGMAAALCVEEKIQPRKLSVRSLQEALLSDPTAPSAVVPFYNLPPSHPDWKNKQLEILDKPELYSPSGYCDRLQKHQAAITLAEQQRLETFQGLLEMHDKHQYRFTDNGSDTQWQIVTLDAEIHDQLNILDAQESKVKVKLRGWPNTAGEWIRVYSLEVLKSDAK